MSLAVESISKSEEAEQRRSRIVGWLFRAAGIVTLGGAMWIILWIDNRASDRSASANASCDSGHCKCSRNAPDARTSGSR